MPGGWFDECTALNLWLEDQATGGSPNEKRVVVAGCDRRGDFERLQQVAVPSTCQVAWTSLLLPRLRVMSPSIAPTAPGSNCQAFRSRRPTSLGGNRRSGAPKWCPKAIPGKPTQRPRAEAMAVAMPSLHHVNAMSLALHRTLAACP